MAATNFQVELPNTLPSGGAIIRLVNKPSVIPALGFTIGTADDTYPSSGTPTTPTLGLGTLSIVSGVIDATYDGDRYIWSAGAPCVVVAIIFMQSVIEATGASSTINVRKCATGVALASGTSLLSGGTAINMKTGVVADTPFVAPLSATAGALTLLATDSIGLDFTNALTEYVGCITVYVNFI
jgi:hypothetical protein